MNKYFLPVYHSQLKPWIKWWILKRLNGGQSTLKAVTISSGTLTKVDKSKALSIKEYYGNTVQNGTPSPESPVEIQTISGDNTFTINGNSYRVDLGGKNLFKYPYYNTTMETNGITFTDNGDGSITINGTATAGAIFYIDSSSWAYVSSKVIPKDTYTLNRISTNTNIFLCLNLYDTNNTSTFISSASGNNTFTVSTTQSISNPRIVVNSGTTVNNLTVYPQLELGSKATRFSPYVSNPIELCKIGDYKDKIVNDNGTWKVEKNIGKVVLNGSESWATRSGSTSYAYYVPNVFNMNKAVGLTSHFVFFSGGSTSAQTRECISSANTSKDLALFTNNSSMDTVSNLKAWLSNNNVTVYYSLEPTTTETITNSNLISQLNALYEFYVNSSSVNVSNNSEIPLEVLLEYYGR